jgi:hypothetical protein
LQTLTDRHARSDSREDTRLAIAYGNLVDRNDHCGGPQVLCHAALLLRAIGLRRWTLRPQVPNALDQSRLPLKCGEDGWFDFATTRAGNSVIGPLIKSLLNAPEAYMSEVLQPLKVEAVTPPAFK